MLHEFYGSNLFTVKSGILGPLNSEIFPESTFKYILPFISRDITILTQNLAKDHLRCRNFFGFALSGHPVKSCVTSGRISSVCFTVRLASSYSALERAGRVNGLFSL